MATLRASRSAVASSRQCQSVRLALPSRPARVIAKAQQVENVQAETVKLGQTVALSAAVSTLMSCGNALAASELAQVAAGDGRLNTILLLFVPPVAWALFNAGSGLLNQLDVMSERAAEADRSVRVKRGIAATLGLGAAGLLATTPAAEAATEMAQLAANDGRLNTILLLFVPPVAWALFNAGQGLLSQMDVMSERAAEANRSVRVKRGIAATLGLGAAGLLATTPAAEAATEMAQLAANDGRLNTILLLFVPPVAWALFNAGQGLLNQLDVMGERAAEANRSVRIKKGIAATLGLGAAGLLATTPAAEAATELAQLAANDGRLNTILLLFVPPVAWALFNAGSAALSQMDVMSERAAEANRSVRVKRGIAATLGLGAAGLLATTPAAEAATEMAQLAANDGRLNTILLLFVPPVAWALFNAGQGLLNQLDVMGERAAEANRSVRIKKGIAATLGLGAAGLLATTPAAQAATEMAQLAANDGRLNTILLLFVPPVAWALFNAGSGLLNQMDVMSERAAEADRSVRVKRGIAATLGLGAAGLLATTPAAEAATELAQLAANDGRLNTILLLFVPPVAWALFNAGQGLLNQLDKMSEARDSADPSIRKRK